MRGMFTRRTLISTSFLMGCHAVVRTPEQTFTPEQFGAKGDGITNDSDALTRMAAAVSLAGGGTIVFRPVTYIVGRQSSGLPGKFAFPPPDLLSFTNCSMPLILRGNGATLKAATGLRYGVFRPNGSALSTKMPYLGDGLATPYKAMIHVSGSTGSVEIYDIELAGPGDAVVLGGQYGDTGWQIPGSGILLTENRGPETVRGVYSHHHPLDGIMIDGLDQATGAPRRLIDVRVEDNGRQGCSIVGGRGYRFTNCSFSRTGRGTIRSAPGAGVDIEAENGKSVRDIGFDNCRFADNSGAGLIADSGDSARITLDRCTFIGTTTWSAWPRKPYMRFSGCTFVGSLSNAFGDDDPARAAQFARCLFTDDPALAPRGVVYGGPLADLSSARNVLFDECRFDASHGGTLPWSTHATYVDCTMTQKSRAKSFPRGQFRGRNTIIGNVDLYSSRIAGSLVVNGATVGSR